MVRREVDKSQENPGMIYMADVTAAGFCARGSRRWFESHGFDFRDFLRDGLPCETLLQTGDEMAKKVVRAKWEKRNQQ